MAPPGTQRIHEPGPRQFVNDLLGNRAFERGDARALHRPLEVHLQLASGCNLDCTMCLEHLRPEGQRHGQGLRFLDSAVFDRIEREVLPYSSRLHLGVGGEPMLAPAFLEIVERAHAANQRIHLTTNGTRIATERVAEVLARCVHTLEISVDGATAETYERIRRGASFARLVANLGLLGKHRAWREADDRPRLVLCMVLMRSNVHELPLLVELATRHGADGVAAWPVIPVTDEGRRDVLDLNDARAHVAAAIERARALGIGLDLPFDHGVTDDRPARENRTATLRRLAELGKSARHGPPDRHWCHMPTVALYVFWDGRAYPCANPEAHQGDALGNLSTQEFAEIWNGRPFRNLRAGLASGDVPDVCRRCPILHRAAGPLESAQSDMVSRYGSRDLAPVSGDGQGLVDLAVESGLAAHAHERWFELLGYSHRLEEEVHSQSSANERLGHERDAARLWLEAVTHHRDAARLEIEALVHQRDGARLMVDALVRQRDALERERRALGQHAVTLEAEREHFVRHIANLERILERTRARAVHRTLSNVKDFVLRPKLRPPLRYVPPWVADGSRRAGEPPAKLD